MTRGGRSVLVRLGCLVSVLFMISPLLSGCMSFHSGPMPGEPKAATFNLYSRLRQGVARQGIFQ